MKVNVTQELKQLNGSPVLDTDAEGNATPVIVRVVLVNALMAPVQSDKGVDKMKKYELAEKIYKQDDVELDEKDITLIKERVGEMFAPLVVGFVYNLLKV